jgi:HSP20 family protein
MAIQRYRHPIPSLFDWFEEFPFSPWSQQNEHAIRVEEYTDDGAYTVKAELPGINPEEDLDITVDHGVLTVHAERKEEKKDGKRSEFRYGAFTRSVQLPPGVKEDDIKADYHDGVLTVTVPTIPVEERVKRIPITKGS